MDFWNEYEGKTIAGKFPLKVLLRPEGRNGFFSTSNGSGAPAIIRLTESLNDQEEMLEQWRIVRELNQRNLITIKAFGQTEEDGTPLTYAVMEAGDLSLAEILEDRAMTVDETIEIGASLVPALQALHARGLVHGHLEAAAVFAVGEVIKLRSDCVRKAPEGPDGAEAMHRDVRDLVALFSESLTQRSPARAGGQLVFLPPPFHEIAGRVESGEWGLGEIAKALTRTAFGSAPSHVTPPPAVKKPEPAIPAPIQAPLPSAAVAPGVEGQAETEAPAREPETKNIDRTNTEPSHASRRWIAAACLGVALIVCALPFPTRHPHKKAQAADGEEAPSLAATNVPPKTPATAALLPPVPAVTNPAAPPAAPLERKEAASHSALDRERVWHVVVFTYNRESEAQKKVAAIARKHNSMRPAVFSPSGHAPFLVTLGGAMTLEQADALKRKARSEGFPRDTYARNYAEGAR